METFRQQSKRPRILTSQRFEAGMSVENTSSPLVHREVVPKLSFEESKALNEDLAAIDEAQAIALVTGSVRYIGKLPYNN